MDFNMMDQNENISNNHKTYSNFQPKVKWLDVFVQFWLHIGAIYGLCLLFYVQIYTIIWFILLVYSSAFGITAGAHRLWSHKTYKAKWQLRLILMFLFTIAGGRSAYDWAHEHRVHHKYSETDADPHDARRGFFFSHIGWLMLTQHPDVSAKYKVIDMSDLQHDGFVMFQKKYYVILFIMIGIIFPMAIPFCLWKEDLWSAFLITFVLRFCTTLHMVFSVNSFAHKYGLKPYDRNLGAVENHRVAMATLGEGYHNYHHVFPWDYKTGEFGDIRRNLSTWLIDRFADIGWAYDRKFATQSMIARRVAKTGDGSHLLNLHDHGCHGAVWGFGDKDITKEDHDELHEMCN